MKYLSLFSGIGSEHVAWKNLDWECIYNCENDKTASRVLSFHYPNIPNLGDIKQIDWQTLEHPDLIIGGSPCQSFSQLGKNKGLNDENGKLALAYAKAIKELKPRFFIWENVKSALYSKNNGFGCLLSELLGENEEIYPLQKNWKNAGFFIGNQTAIAYRVLDCQHFGIPQRRKRIFMLGMHFGNTGTLDEIKWEKFPGLPAAILFEAIDNTEYKRETRKKYKISRDNFIVHSSSISFKGRNSIYYDVFPTITKTSPYIYYNGIFRKITPVEMERLQGFPDNYSYCDGISNHKRYHLLGNSIPTNMLEFLGRNIDFTVKQLIKENHYGFNTK